jgi:hypothetical protein
MGKGQHTALYIRHIRQHRFHCSTSGKSFLLERFKVRVDCLIIRFDAVNAQENFVISLGRRVCCVPVLRSTPLTCTNLLSHAQTFSNACVWSNHTCASACTCQHARAHSRAHKRTTERFPKRYLSSSASSTFCILNPIRMRNESILSSARDFKRSAKSLNSYLGFEMCIPEVSNTTPSSC